jgi:hypothetical protein
MARARARESFLQQKQRQAVNSRARKSHLQIIRRETERSIVEVMEGSNALLHLGAPPPELIQPSPIVDEEQLILVDALLQLGAPPPEQIQRAPIVDEEQLLVDQEQPIVDEGQLILVDDQEQLIVDEEPLQLIVDEEPLIIEQLIVVDEQLLVDEEQLLVDQEQPAPIVDEGQLVDDESLGDDEILADNEDMLVDDDDDLHVDDDDEILADNDVMLVDDDDDLHVDDETLRDDDDMLVNDDKIFSDKEQQIVKEAMYGMGPSNEVIVKYDGANSVQRGSFQTLQPGQWLNDEVIHSFLKLLTRRDEGMCRRDPSRKRSHFFKSFFITNLLNDGICNPDLDGKYSYLKMGRYSKKVPGRDIFNLNKIFFPINEGRMHWVCLVAFMKEKRIQMYDSMGSNGMHYLESVLQYLKDEHQAKERTPLPDAHEWRLVPCESDIPRQRNGKLVLCIE